MFSNHDLEAGRFYMSDLTDVFNIHSNIMEDYKNFVHSFINIRDETIKQEVNKGIKAGRFWPEPLISFNPSFEKGQTLQELCDEGILHPEMKEILKDYSLYKHQSEAIKTGSKGLDFVVTSGTGSGKSLAFIATIFNYLLNNKKEKGIKAVIVYPMNALINSQFEAIEDLKNKYMKNHPGEEFPFAFAKYTGQEKQEDREMSQQGLPDIIMTNYMMLELILTRPQEYMIRDSIYENLKYMVFDELHTYRGRQGADVAMLVARIKAQAHNEVSCIGTSATMVSGGTGSLWDQELRVAEIAGKLLGSRFLENQIINESLTRCFEYNGALPSAEALKQNLDKGIDLSAGEPELIRSPLSTWIENAIALKMKDGVPVRNLPMKFSDIAAKLSSDSGAPLDLCETQLRTYLKWISIVNKQTAEKHVFYLPYKIHQFISQTGTVYASLHKGPERIVTLDPTLFKRKGDEKIPLYPVVFSRESGREFICVTLNEGTHALKPREFTDIDGDDEDDDGNEENKKNGYVIPSPDVWNPDNDMELLPDAWVKTDCFGVMKPIDAYKNRMPREIYYDDLGNFSFEKPLKPVHQGWFMTAKLLFDPTSGVIYDPRTSENTKLTRLGSEGRSTSTTVLNFSILKQLAKCGFQPEEQKVLSFTDNRQDAALQSGHFNDFLKVAQLRSAIYHALEKYNELDFSNLDTAIFEALKLNQEEYAAAPSDIGVVKKENEGIFKDYLMYQALKDLRYSWRVILPNLEQCALFEIHYKFLKEICCEQNIWDKVPILNRISADEREKIIYQVLDCFRKSYALQNDEYFSPQSISRKRKIIYEKLLDSWRFEEKEIIEPFYLRFKTLKGAGYYTASIGPSSALGKYLREEARSRGFDLKGQDYTKFIEALMKTMTRAGLLEETGAEASDGTQTGLYRLRLDRLTWKRGDGKNMIPDLVKKRIYKEDYKPEPNSFFQDMYRTDFTGLKRIYSKEHTGQLNNEDRKKREEDFRKGEISTLFCSPTMELGIDISSLNVVHMRNVPPSPSNYAQRGGRAGRNGQAALVFTSCSNYSPHDRHYFDRQPDMVAGVVAPPKLDLDNRELIQCHLHALFLAKAGIPELRNSISDLVDMQDKEKLPLLPGILEALQINNEAKNEIKLVFDRIVKDIKERELLNAAWLTPQWIEETLNRAPTSFDNALGRWRKMYKDAEKQLDEAQAIIKSGTYTKNSKEMSGARRKEGQALTQRELLENKANGKTQTYSEFYPYRYLASEGFLPGYNFTRLPVRAFIPKGDSGEYVSRPRFIAIREFGPGSIIYHNGKKFRVEQLMLPEIEKNSKKAKVSKNSGYILMDHEYDANNCPFTGASLTDGYSRERFEDLLPMAETRTVEIDRISCAEEERMSRGYEIDTYFSIPGGVDTVRKAKVKSRDQGFLDLAYIPSARLFQVNKKWKISYKSGFRIGLRSGLWKKAPGKEKNNRDIKENAEEYRSVQLYTHNTAAALYIEPIKALALTPSGVITFMYALKRAIENIFQVEPSEINVQLMGDDACPNIFLYEDAEGSLGILSQFISDIGIFKSIIDEAYNLCRFDDPEYLEDASYDDLLSYYNQGHHDYINRFEIKDALEKLKLCRVELSSYHKGFDYDTHYRDLLMQVDPNSAMEERFLNHLYRKGSRLPDGAQQITVGIYCRPDFFYAPDIHVFCDGTPHDKPEVQEMDQKRREAIRNRGAQVLVWNYKERLEDFIAKRPDIFKKVR